MPIITSNTALIKTQEYLSKLRVVSEETKNDRLIYQFTEGMYDLGLWDSMICWPLRSEQNAGTGTTAYSLGGLGTFDGTLVNGPTWGVDGITFGGVTQYIEYAPQFPVDFTKGGYSVHAAISLMGVAVIDFGVGGDRFDIFSSTGVELANVYTNGVYGGTSYTLQSRNYDGNRYFRASANYTNTPVTGNTAYGWNAETRILQSDGSDLNMGSEPTAVQSNGNYTIRTRGRTNSTASATSRVSYLMAFSPNIGMTSSRMTAIYNLAKQTLGQGLGLP
jgi:hypothetical protein